MGRPKGSKNKPKLAPQPAPGSDAALIKGCACPVLDNHHGKGLGDGKFWINTECKLHGTITPL